MIDGLVGFQEFSNHRACEQVPPRGGLGKEMLTVDLQAESNRAWKFQIGDFRTGKRR
jgi:hypothetical protein